MRTKDVAINIALAAASLACTVLVLEVALRVTGIEKGRPVPVEIYAANSNPNISYALKPNMRERALRSTITTNSSGYRSGELDPAKKTLLFLGDSVTFGYGLEDHETIPAHVGKMVPEWNVLNTAAPGYNLMQEAATYKEVTKTVRPDALVLVFNFNDLDAMDPAVLDTDGVLRPKELAGKEKVTCIPVETGILSYVPGSCWLDLHSSIYRVLKKIAITRSGNARKAVEEHQNVSMVFSESIPQEKIDRYIREFRTFGALLPRNMPKLMVLWPDRQLHTELRKTLDRIAREQGFEVLDLYQVFGNRAETLSWDTSHPSAKTAEEAAKVIFAALTEWKMIK